YKWCLGIALPMAMAGYGLYGVITRHIIMMGRASMQLTGRNAAALGIAGIAAAVFVHCHYFWGNIYDQAWFAVLGKILGASGFILALGYLMIRSGVLGINN
ncbi:MAG: hypothetical protein JWM57_1091, partial [Phycisphaerales bacterium]|nr:hypothetical protein [Phycisphaerales bacterium]